jgi:hypothetical protein
MSRLADRREKMIRLSAPMLISLVVLVVSGLSRVPPVTLAHGLTIITAWTCLAVPLAVLFGHCALSEN